MTLATAEKGRLEIILDDFTEVHGSVLLGMHRELQTLKMDVLQGTDERLRNALSEINELGVQLGHRIEKFQEISDAIGSQEKAGLDSIEAAADKAVNTISAERNSALVDIKNQLHEINQRFLAFQSEVSVARQSVSVEQVAAMRSKALEDISGERASALVELRNLSHDIEQSRQAFLDDVSGTQQSGVDEKKDFQVKLSAALNYANKVNAESRVLLKKVNERQKALHQREIQLNKRTRELMAGAGLLIVAIFGFGVWLLLNH